MKEYAFGIDVGGTSIKFGLFKNGQILEKWSIPTDDTNHGINVASDIAASIKSKINKYNLTNKDIKGAGMGVPGAVHSGGYLEPCVNIDGWGGEGLDKEFEKLCGFPFLLANDANAAGLGEMREGGGKGFDNLYCVTLGTGVGGCLIINRKLIEGAHGCAGEIGHIHVNDNEVRNCGCKKRGCLEQYASATGIVECAKIYLEKNDCESSLKNIDNLSCKDIFDHAKAGDSLGLKIVDDTALLLGKTLAGIACVCNPEAIVIGGGVASAGDFLIDRIRNSFCEYAFASSVKTKITSATLGNDAGIWGGLELADSAF